jgi:hypothetical protein
MKSLNAMILLVPVIALFFEVIGAASNCRQLAAGGECAGMGKIQEKCIRAGSHQACAGCGQSCNKEHPGKNKKKERDSGGCCIDCPLCLLVTVKPFFRLEVTRQSVVSEYSVMPDNNLSDYFQKHWKPPNASLFS